MTFGFIIYLKIINLTIKTDMNFNPSKAQDISVLIKFNRHTHPQWPGCPDHGSNTPQQVQTHILNPTAELASCRPSSWSELSPWRTSDRLGYYGKAWQHFNFWASKWESHILNSTDLSSVPKTWDFKNWSTAYLGYQVWIFVANKKGTPEMQLMTLWFLAHSSVNVSIWSLKLYDLIGTTQITGFLVETFKATNKSFRWRSCQYKTISSCIQLKVSLSSPSNVKHYFLFYFLKMKKVTNGNFTTAVLVCFK